MNRLIRKETTLTMSDPHSAGQKPLTMKPALNQLTAMLEANQKVSAFTTRMNSPIVRTMSPQDRRVSTGRMTAFTTDNTIAITVRAIHPEDPWISIPGTSSAAPYSEAMITSMRMMIRIVSSFPYTTAF